MSTYTVKFFVLILLFFFVSAFSGFTQFEVPSTKITVLGTYHFSNPGLDSFNMEADDVFTPKRQQEIEDLLTTLSTFKPTKILVESAWDNERTQDKFEQYLDDEYEPSRNEIDQIGYRLAAQLGHDAVYPVDYRMSMDDGVDGEALERLYPMVEEDLSAYGKAYSAFQSENLEGSTIGEFLAFMNSPEMIDANHFFYMAYDMKVGEGEDFVGPELVANWYKRNILILHNIMRAANDDGSDRLLLIIGQGHAKILNQLLDDSPYFEREDVLNYLPEVEN